ncbi:hypothetical protein SSX86_019036 [Deinandra increscens subsp. villosa]|uniref:Cyclin-dependent kinase inhibitor n=1 Tax=Deinandra increscens subsp. villosa TaxID=3103831 RepID=A0AAP0CX03_9ASTR
MEPQVGGVWTRARTRAMAEKTADNSSGGVKRRKISNKKFNKSSSTFVKTKTFDCEINHIRNQNSCFHAAARYRRSGGVPASCCSSTGTMEKLKVSDLEESVEETETTARCNLDESAPPITSEFKSSASKRSMVTNKTCGTVIPGEKKPPEDELEGFFAAAQEGLSERFKNKYNYDIVNDTPLKGRFEWIGIINQEK